ncbi:hypothetical protein HHK36_022187 [Tetracentron sinense]|uniref:beta-glucosidase n=1 Tax=Tetracentron sinense TaxID=13715 RepID=A0A835D9C9_TETSI|nr:hypothetical protein HHK36_022187 [Tetracentron sinense]
MQERKEIQKFEVESKTFEVLEVVLCESFALKIMDRQRRRGSNSLWVSEETIQWLIKIVKDLIDSLGYCFRKFRGRRCTLMGEKRSNVRGEFIVFQAYLREEAEGRVIISIGNRQSGWAALLSALGVVDSSRSSKGKGGTMLSRPVMRYGQSIDLREEFVSLNEKEMTSKKVEVDQADGDFQHWAMAVVCSIAGLEGTGDWEEVAKIINKLIPEEESVTLFPFEAHRAIYRTKKESHISGILNSGRALALQLHLKLEPQAFLMFLLHVLRNKVAACAKHFVDDGGTTKDINENNTVIDRPGLLCTRLPAYYNSIIEGVNRHESPTQAGMRKDAFQP